jgi:hypothetical protein
MEGVKSDPLKRDGASFAYSKIGLGYFSFSHSSWDIIIHPLLWRHCAAQNGLFRVAHVHVSEQY